MSLIFFTRLSLPVYTLGGGLLGGSIFDEPFHVSGSVLDERKQISAVSVLATGNLWYHVSLKPLK